MKSSRKYLLATAVVAMIFAATASQASAYWGRCGAPCRVSCYGAWSAYSSCCTPSCYSTYTCYAPRRAVSCCDTSCGGGWYVGVRPGPVRRLLLGPCRWYWGGGYFAGCYTGCCASWSCDDGCCNGDSTPAQTPTPAQKAAPTPAAPAPAPAMPAPVTPKTTSNSAAESGILTVWVPYDAKVTINGRETTSKGSRRQFVSYGLKSGLSYKYEIKAQIVRDGQVQEDSRTIILKAGDVTAVAFGFNATAEQQVAATW